MRNRVTTVMVLTATLWLITAGGPRTASAQSAQPTTSEPAAAEPSTVAGDAPAAKRDVVYGTALRPRWVSIPGWFLSLFTDENVALSSYGIGGEFFRRKGDMDIAFGLTWQKMGPPEGNWLGRGNDPTLDTDLVQFRNFGFVGFDVSFLWRTRLNDYISTRYGAGLGLAIVTGKMLRVSAGTPGCKDDPGDETGCRPIYCPATGCTETLHKMNEGRPDTGPDNPHRFADNNIPGAIPVLNFVMGFDFRIPDVNGLELRVDAGFYDAFFLGIGSAYLF
jgi:hypothetical protein